MQISANTIEKTGMNKNKGIRCPIKISDFQDVNIVSFNVEKNHPHSSVSSQRDFAYYTIRYILKGYGTATYNGVKTRLKPDMLFVTYPNSNSTIVQDCEDPYTLAWFVCDGAKVKKYCTESESIARIYFYNSPRTISSETCSQKHRANAKTIFPVPT